MDNNCISSLVEEIQSIMNVSENYLEINKKLWNNKTDVHIQSDFYYIPGFLKGATSLKPIELSLLGEIRGKRILHLQCHFGQDSISLARMGAEVTGVDFSERAIDQAILLSEKTKTNIRFINADVYKLSEIINEQFDIIFTSYGVLGWLPDMKKWSQVVNHFLSPGGKLILVEFHPVVWMFDDNISHIQYSYFNKEAIVETTSGTYADKSAPLNNLSISWNHGLGEVITALTGQNLKVIDFKEYDYSPYNCLSRLIERDPGKFHFEHLPEKIPIVYSLVVVK
jgi:2-polyprenyl-3-methyl-5-hydroxy-6-metoxy-1,4-benzoquinol methylase